MIDAGELGSRNGQMSGGQNRCLKGIINREFLRLSQFDLYQNAIPCIDPNFDHSPRSGIRGTIMVDSTPKKWGEGNYLEPDLRFGMEYLVETKRQLIG